MIVVLTLGVVATKVGVFIGMALTQLSKFFQLQVVTLVLCNMYLNFITA